MAPTLSIIPRTPFVAGEIVHNDHVTGAQLGQQHLLDVSLERKAVDGPVDDKGRVGFARGMRTLFSGVMLRRLTKRWIVPKPKKRPRSARLRRTSSKVASFSGPKASTITLICASIRAERRSPPSVLGRGVALFTLTTAPAADTGSAHTNLPLQLGATRPGRPPPEPEPANPSIKPSTCPPPPVAWHLIRVFLSLCGDDY